MHQSLVPVCVLVCGMLSAAQAAAPSVGPDARAGVPGAAPRETRTAMWIRSGPIVGAQAAGTSARGRAPIGGRPIQRVVWSEEVERPGAAWIRVEFGDVDLSSGGGGVRESFLRVTSLADGHEQYLDADDLRVWGYTSAYFNGDAVRVELLSAPNSTTADRVEITGVRSTDQVAPASLCGPDDDRVLSDDPRVARLMPIGCTAWLFGDQGSSMLTAGHCTPSGGNVVQFNVPISTSTGSYVHPAPIDQYVVDGASVQTTGGETSLGNDWGFFGVFDNTDTGMTPLEAQGDSFTLASSHIDSDGRPIRVTGYGTTSSPVDPSYNGAQKTHAGPYVGRAGTMLQYSADTTGGNSGSPVIDDLNGRVIGIHTNAGCSTGGGWNHGCDIFNEGLQAALANPRGMAAPRPIEASLASTPEFVSPAGGDELALIIGETHGSTIVDGPYLMINQGAGFEPILATPTDGQRFAATLPETACGTQISYYFELSASNGSTTRVPAGGASTPRYTVALETSSLIFGDDFQTDTGWGVEEPVETVGGWERGNPDPLSNSGPTVDGDGSGECYTTGLDRFEDLDRAGTTLLSPVIPFSGVENATLSALVFVESEDGEPLRIELSGDEGLTWIDAGEVGNTEGWEMVRFTLADMLGAVPSVRVRFTIADSGASSTVEAGVDAVTVSADTCESDVCVGDFDGDNIVTIGDMFTFMGAFRSGDPSSDLNKDGSLNYIDISIYMTLYAQGCP